MVSDFDIAVKELEKKERRTKKGKKDAGDGE